MTTLQSGMTIGPDDREAWLLARQQTIGASEAAAACGVSPYQTPLDLYLRKVGLAEPVAETMAMRLGNLLEPVIATLFQEETGATIARQQVYARSTRYPHLSATIDGITADGKVVEFKTMGSRMAGLLGDEGTDELPDSWVLQAAQQLVVAETAGLDVDTSGVDFAVLVGGQEFRRFRVEANEALLATMLAKLDEFWDRVVRRDPPPVTRPSDAGILHLLHPAPGPTIEGDEALADHVFHYADMGGVIKEREDDRKMTKARILEAMGGASVAVLPDGTRVSRKVIERAETTVVQSACSYSQIYISKPKRK